MKIDRTPVVKQVTDYFAKNIKDGTWKVEEKIPSENTLVEDLQVSRPTIRAAIQQYNALGILQSIHGKGTYLKTDQVSLILQGKKEILSKEDFSDVKKVLEFRRCLEPETCYLAAERMTDKSLKLITEQYEMMKESVGNRKVFVEKDLQFHLEIARASQNKLILGCLTEVFEQMVRHLELLNQLFGYDGIYYHQRILDAFKEKNPEKAKQEMEEHLQHAITSLSSK